MWPSLVLFLFIIALVTDSTKAVDKNDLNDDEHGNRSFIQPRQSSFFVNLDARSLTAATIHTPNFPRKYKPRSTVDWGFTATGSIELFCPVFKLRPKRKGKCLDYLEVECEYDGNISIQRYCHDDLNEDGFTIVATPTSVIQLKLTFKSSKKTNKRFIGFSCTVSSPPITTTTQDSSTYIYPNYTCVSPNFTIIAGTEYGCPCSYNGAIPTGEAMPGAQCCQPSDCPNSNFTSLHVCGRDDGQACRNTTDAFEFAKQAWTDPSAIVGSYVFSCQGISYELIDDICVMKEGVEFWGCNLDAGSVYAGCYNVTNRRCKIDSNAKDGSMLKDTMSCTFD